MIYELFSADREGIGPHLKVERLTTVGRSYHHRCLKYLF